MKDLKELRTEINEIDNEMIKLFEKRMDLSKKIYEYKNIYNLPILDKTRENEIIENNILKIKNKKYITYYKKFIEEIMNLSKDFQNDLKKED